MSCSGTIMDGSSKTDELTINGMGSMSLKNSIINSNGENTTINLHGAFAGYDSLIKYNLGDFCAINSYNNVCYGLTLYCSTKNYCTIGCNNSNNIDNTYGSCQNENDLIKCDDYQVDLISILD